MDIKLETTGNFDDIGSATRDIPEYLEIDEDDLEIDEDWAEIARRSREQWSKENPE